MMIQITTTVEVPGMPLFMQDGIYVVSDELGRALIERGQAREAKPTAETAKVLEKAKVLKPTNNE